MQDTCTNSKNIENRDTKLNRAGTYKIHEKCYKTKNYLISMLVLLTCLFLILTSFGVHHNKQANTVFASTQTVYLYVPDNNLSFLGEDRICVNMRYHSTLWNVYLDWNGNYYYGGINRVPEKDPDIESYYVSFSTGIPTNYYNSGYRYVQTGNSQSSNLSIVYDGQSRVDNPSWGDITKGISLTFKIAQIGSITYYDAGDSENIAYSGSNKSSLPTQYISGTEKTLVNGVKKGYTFGGWYENYQCTGSSVSFISAGATGDKTFYAKWTPQVYDIKYYHANTTTEFTSAEWGGVSHPTSHTYGTATQLVTPSGANYVFDGWYTNVSCTGTKITNLGATAYTSTITLYGKITKTRSTISIEVEVKGVYNSGIIIYVLKNGAMQNQIVVLGSDTMNYTYDIDNSATYTLLVCKPYMWTMTAEGLTPTGNKMEFVATNDDRALKLTFSGGATSNSMVVI